jgi:ornithine cyclodeaminase/alanine dehydrogenase
MTTLLLTRSEVRSVVEMPAVVAAVEEVFAAEGRGETQMPPKVYLNLAEYRGDFRAMPAYAAGSAGVKWVNSHPLNPERYGLPAVLGMYVLSDPATALPLAVMDATLLTALRTGAAAAVATKYLARPGSRTVGFVGCGVQAATMLEALRVGFPELAVFAADLSTEAASSFAEACGGESTTVERAAGCDIVCTSTPSTTPVVRCEWVRMGAHINAMGADAQGKQELASELLAGSKVIIDDWQQASHSGEVNVPVAEGVLDRSSIHASLGELAAGAKPGRESEDEVTIFDSTGLAVQDLALARLVYEVARARGVGRELDFSG